MYARFVGTTEDIRVAKYEVSHAVGPWLREARNSPGLHVYSDCTPKREKHGSQAHYAGVYIYRRTEDGQVNGPYTTRKLYPTPSVNAGEARAFQLGVELTMNSRSDDGHLFFYVDNLTVTRAMVSADRLQGIRQVESAVKEAFEQLPSPDSYSILRISGDDNLAHEVARNEEIRDPPATS